MSSMRRRGDNRVNDGGESGSKVRAAVIAAANAIAAAAAMEAAAAMATATPLNHQTMKRHTKTNQKTASVMWRGVMTRCDRGGTY